MEQTKNETTINKILLTTIIILTITLAALIITNITQKNNTNQQIQELNYTKNYYKNTTIELYQLSEQIQEITNTCINTVQIITQDTKIQPINALTTPLNQIMIYD